jgi:Protein of unknown function (DUF732)
MKTTRRVVALSITAAALVTGTGVAHADPDQDQKYLNYLIYHGMGPTSGVSQSQWRSDAIGSGHKICQYLESGHTKNDLMAQYLREHPTDDENTVSTLADAAMNAYCPDTKYRN